MRTSTKILGDRIRETRKLLGVTQKDLALTAGTGLRFIIELEKGKEHLSDRQSAHRPEYAGRQAGADAARHPPGQSMKQNEEQSKSQHEAPRPEPSRN